MLPMQLPELKSIPLLGEVGLLTTSCHSAGVKGRRDLTSHWLSITVVPCYSPAWRPLKSVLLQSASLVLINNLSKAHLDYVFISPGCITACENERLRPLHTHVSLSIFRVLNSTMFESWAIVGPYPSWWLFNSLLLVLQVLHIIWSYLIARIAVKAILRGKVSHPTALTAST